MQGFKGKLIDQLAIQYLMEAYPPDLVEYAIRSTGRTGARTRMLPPLLVVYFVLAMCLFTEAGYEQVWQLLGRGLARHGRWPAGSLAATPSTAAVSRARVRLGSLPLRELLARAMDGHGAKPHEYPETRYRRWRVRTVDDHVATVPYGQDTLTVRGRADGAWLSCPVPAGIRVSVLAEHGTWQLVAAHVSGDGDHTQIPFEVTRALRRGDLLLAGDGSDRPGWWQTTAANGTDLLWSVPAAVPSPVGGVLADGSRLCVSRGGTWIPRGTAVRVLGDPGPGPRALITTILDPAAAPAAELAALHERRWRFRQAEVFRDQLELPIRSRSREMAEQEIWGHLLVYSAMRRRLRRLPARVGDVTDG